MHDEDGTDDQIDELLCRAHARLSGKEYQGTATPRRSAHETHDGVALRCLVPAVPDQPIMTRSDCLSSGLKLNTSSIVRPYVAQDGDVAHADMHRLLDDRERQLSSKVRRVEDPVSLMKKHNESKKATAGAAWFNLPRTILTSELKRDLQLLKMRSVLDPKRHYKKESATPKELEFSQVGTILEGPTEFYSARLQSKDRKRTLVEEVMVGDSATGRFKNKYAEVQASKTSGRKAHYNALKAKRSRDLRS